MATIHDAPVDQLIEKAASLLDIKMPEWAAFVKTGAAKERPPIRDDWWKVRAASILRTVYLKGPIGVNKLRLKFGSKKNRGHKPSRFAKSGGKILRVALQQLEKAGLIEQKAVGVHKGRVVTNQGKSFMDKIASSLTNGKVTKQKNKASKKE